jgi:hypothetical protein
VCVSGFFCMFVRACLFMCLWLSVSVHVHVHVHVSVSVVCNAGLQFRIQRCDYICRQATSVCECIWRQPLFVSAYEGNLFLWMHMRQPFFVSANEGNLCEYIRRQATSVRTPYAHKTARIDFLYCVILCGNLWAARHTLTLYLRFVIDKQTCVLWFTIKPGFCDWQ